MQKRARKCYLWGSSKDKVKEGIKIHSALRALRARRARAASEASPPQIPGRAAENFFLRVHFRKRKKFRGRRFQDRSKICTYSRTLGGKLGAIQHKTTQTEPSFGVKRPHQNKPKCKKSQDWTFTRNQMASQKQTKTQKSSRLNLHAGPTGNTKRRFWNSTFNALFSKVNLHSKSLFVTPPICLYNSAFSLGAQRPQFVNLSYSNFEVTVTELVGCIFENAPYQCNSREY